MKEKQKRKEIPKLLSNKQLLSLDEKLLRVYTFCLI